MVCFSPLVGYRAATVNENGKRPIVFNKKDGLVDRPVNVPCGQCIGCRLEKSRQWAMRCVHEASLYEDNCFITLTYDDEHLPLDGSLSVREFQLFMKRLRKKYGEGIRFFHCGEYGSKFGRPHYHAIIFNFDFSDRKLFKVNHGFRLYSSDMLSELWPFGHCLIGDVTFQSAAYVARYVTKKVTGVAADEHYTRISPDGEVFKIKEEYTTMSRRPGIGAEWFRKYRKDLLRSDAVVINGVEVKPPKFYDGMFEMEEDARFARNKRKRVLKAKKRVAKDGQPRLLVRKKVQEARLKVLRRGFDQES